MPNSAKIDLLQLCKGMDTETLSIEPLVGFLQHCQTLLGKRRSHWDYLVPWHSPWRYSTVGTRKGPTQSPPIAGCSDGHTLCMWLELICQISNLLVMPRTKHLPYHSSARCPYLPSPFICARTIFPYSS